MNDIIKGVKLNKIDINSRKELDENTWRKASLDDDKVIAGYFSYGAARNINNSLRVVFGIIFLISIGELIFEWICRNDPSYDPIPMYICIAFSATAVFINEIINKMQRVKQLARVNGNVYVTEAVANYSGNNKIIIKINGKAISFDNYEFKESVNPMDYVYDENNNKIGFRVVLFDVIIDGDLEKKIVLGSEGYNYYLQRGAKVLKN